jgi:hypothetical protein
MTTIWLLGGIVLMLTVRRDAGTPLLPLEDPVVLKGNALKGW